MITIIDYGAGNIASVKNAFDFLGIKTVLSSDPELIKNSKAVILPGVGSFGDAMDNIDKNGLRQTIVDFANSGKPFLGICLGLQLLFEKSEESVGVKGLGIIKGEVIKFPTNKDLKVPHMGWNSLSCEKNSPLFYDLGENPYVYFVHSYYVKAHEDVVIAHTDYAVQFGAAVQKGNVFACQFHPEKSGEVGLKIIKNFAKVVSENAR